MVAFPCWGDLQLKRAADTKVSRGEFEGNGEPPLLYILLGLSLRLLVVTVLTIVLFLDSVGGKRGFDGC